LEAELKQAVAGQMVADVPLGAFLSGGIDSSAVVALMQAQSSRPVKTFTIGFAEAGYNEAAHAKAVATHLGTDHTEMYVTTDQAREVIPRLPQIYDEPFGDSSAIPNFLISQLVRRHVTVSLSGDGGDELFGGYDRYFKVDALWQMVQPLPIFMRKLGHAVLRSRSISRLDRILHCLSGQYRNLGFFAPARVRLLAKLLKSESFCYFYQTFLSNSNFLANKNPKKALSFGLTPPQQKILMQNVSQMMAQDSVSYLPDDILVKVDRAAMAVGLEIRVPLLDHRVVELAWRFPCHLKIRKRQGKWLLRQLLDRYVPQKLIDRPKQGFGVPVDQWLRGPLREWGEDMLDVHRLKQQDFVDANTARECWEEHQCGRYNWRDNLWLLLMWQAWYSSNK